jgi:hypothetical protein
VPTQPEGCKDQFQRVRGKPPERKPHSTSQAISLRTKISRHFAASLTDTVAQNVPLDWHFGAAP